MKALRCNDLASTSESIEQRPTTGTCHELRRGCFEDVIVLVNVSVEKLNLLRAIDLRDRRYLSDLHVKVDWLMADGAFTFELCLAELEHLNTLLAIVLCIELILHSCDLGEHSGLRRKLGLVL